MIAAYDMEETSFDGISSTKYHDPEVLSIPQCH